MRVGLVSHVPDQAVVRRLEDIVKGNRQLDGTQPGCEVTATGRDRLNEEFPQLAGYRGQLGQRKLAQIRRGLDNAQQRVFIGRRCHFGEFTQT